MYTVSLLARRAGHVLIAVFTFLGASWITAEAFMTADGWRAAGLVAAWLLPLVVLLTVSWYSPDLATVLLSALTAVIAVAIGTWFAVDPEPWRAFENDNGPIRAIITLVLAAPIALLSRTRPRTASVLFVVLGVVPVALATAGTASGLGSLIVVSVPATLTGLLYLLADTLTAHAVAQQPFTATRTPATTGTPLGRVIRHRGRAPAGRWRGAWQRGTVRLIHRAGPHGARRRPAHR